MLRKLPSDGSAVTAREIAARIGVSVRSVVSYVGEIVREYPELVKSSEKGYTLDASRFREIEAAVAPLPDSSEKRALYMIRRILGSENRPFSIEDFQDELFVGDSTLRKDIPVMRRKLGEFDLSVGQRGGKFVISGSEPGKRRMLAEIMLAEFNDNILSMSAIARAFPDYDAAHLKETLSQICNERRYFINEYSLMNLVLDLFISIDRIKGNHPVPPPKKAYRFGNGEQEMARAIIERLEALYDVKFNRPETDELLLLLFSRLTKVDYSTLTLENIGETVDAETLRIVELVKSELDVPGFMDFGNAELMLYFTLHLDNMLWRLERNYATKNPLTEQIKTGCA
ncbi:MAG: helix-turn-helix domain-containing protein, partial [Treponema sp.]|nr:helix-turn-helix domain-containing protein [Treponema sp.]